MLITENKTQHGPLLGSYGHLIDTIILGNDQDSIWSLDYIAPGFSFTTKDNKLMELAYNYCRSTGMLIAQDITLGDVLLKDGK